MTFGRALEEGIKDRGSDSHGWNILPDLSLRTRHSVSRGSGCRGSSYVRKSSKCAAERRKVRVGKQSTWHCRTIEPLGTGAAFTKPVVLPQSLRSGSHSQRQQSN